MPYVRLGVGHGASSKCAYCRFRRLGQRGKPKAGPAARRTVPKASTLKRQIGPKRTRRMASNAKREQAKRLVTPKRISQKAKTHARKAKTHARKAKAQSLKSEDPNPKAKPFFCDNSANEGAMDWILGQLPKRACFPPGLHALLLLRSSAPPVPPRPRCCVRVPCRSMALPRSRPEGSKQKIGSQCNFFAIRDYCRPFQSQIESQKRRWSALGRPISALKRQRRVRNREKVAKAFGFLFLR